MNDSTVAALRKLKDGNGAYLWQPSVQAGQPDKLLGYDIYTSPYVPAMAAGAYANVAAATISGWYTQVYEPSFTE